MLRRRLSVNLILLCFVLNLSFSATAQTAGGLNRIVVHPRDRITGFVDDQIRVILPGNRHPLARAEYEVGIVPPDFPMERMILTFEPDARQQRALDQLVAAQHDPHSSYYHQWLTPQSFGEHFGVSENDLTQVTSWLQLHGMSVEEITAGRQSLIFSGTAAQVESAFHTQIRVYRVRGELHHANASDPQIPLSLARVVAGPVSLHDFRRLPLHQQIRRVSPEFSYYGSYYLAPADFATIYNVLPLYQQSITGSGQSVAIVGRTNIHMSDVELFRSSFGLPANNPQIILNGSDPGVVSTDEESEADLDVEWSGAVARNASIKFVVSASTNSSDGVDLSAQYIVNHNLAPVMSTSFGLCEARLGSAGNSFLNGLWQQAAAQGITAFISSGDSGAAGCDPASASSGTAGRGVNGLCSSPYDVCVGGTEFNDTSNPARYWSPNNDPTTQASALSYIPENVWNESGSSGSGLWASGGGVSTLYAKPSWQTGTGVPADGKRDVPDVSLTAAGHDAYLVFIEGSLNAISGTSAASPSFAGLMALVVQKTAARQGNANSVFYALANKQRSAGGAAIFHDVASGNNSVPGVTGFNAGPGYDLATGLGSVDANLLVTHWADAFVTPAFQLSPASNSVSVTAGASANLNVTVSVSGGFNAAVSLSASKLPSGVSATLTPASFPAPGSGTSVLKLTATAGVQPGTYSINLAATGGGTTKTATLTLTVNPAPSFTIVSPSSASVAAGKSVTVTVTTQAQGEFKSALALSAAGAPAGVTASFNPKSIAAPGTGSSKLTLTAASSARVGASKLTLTATGGGLTRSATLTLTVSAR